MYQVQQLEAEKEAMQASHSKTVAELENRLLQQELKYKAEIAERDSEMSEIQQSAEEKFRESQTLALSEQEFLLSKIRFVLSSQTWLPNRNM